MIQGLIRIGIVLIILIALGTTGFFVFTKYRGQDARLRADKLLLGSAGVRPR